MRLYLRSSGIAVVNPDNSTGDPNDPVSLREFLLQKIDYNSEEFGI
jgi:hypothetical protein